LTARDGHAGDLVAAGWVYGKGRGRLTVGDGRLVTEDIAGCRDRDNEVALYLLHAGDRLILVDTGWPGSGYQYWTNIERMGFNPREITDVLISHGHGEHYGTARRRQGDPRLRQAHERQPQDSAAATCRAAARWSHTAPALAHRRSSGPSGSAAAPRPRPSSPASGPAAPTGSTSLARARSSCQLTGRRDQSVS